MRGLETIRADAPDDPVAATSLVVRERLGRGEKIMGFGHRCLQDPRTRGPPTCASCPRSWRRHPCDDTYYRMSREMEKVVFAEKGLYPNVDFYAASVYHYLGIPTDLFTPVFSVSRMPAGRPTSWSSTRTIG